MVELEQNLSVLTGTEGYDSCYSLSEFTDHLNADLSSKQTYGKWVFWRRERSKQSEYELLYHHSKSTSCKTDIKDKIKSVLKHIASRYCWPSSYMVQFWAAKADDGGHHYLTTSDQPFSVYDLSKGLCWYRKLCMDQCCCVGETAKEEQLRGIGRVYRNKRPESTPDLRLYSTNEFPLRDFAARCGLRSYLAVPVFDLHNSECYGVLELLTFYVASETTEFLSVNQGLQVAELRSTHTDIDKKMPSKYKEQPKSELSKMLELAMKAVPQLHLAQVWVPCKQCANIDSNLSCLERATFITAQDGVVNSCMYTDSDMLRYLQACELHNLQMEKGIVRALMSSNGKSCFCQNLCDISISENPLAHYAQKARLSFCFVVSLESMRNGNDLYVVEFFLQSNYRADIRGDSFLHLLLKIMQRELKSFKIALGGQLGEELVVGLTQPNATGYEFIKHVQEMSHPHSEEPNMSMLMEQCRESYSELNFQKYMQMAGLCCLRPSEEGQHGWVFCSLEREELFENDAHSNSSLVPNPIKKNIELLMKKIASDLLDSYSLVQFWAPKMEEDRCYLATSDQPYAVGSLAKGLASFRKLCMKHHYFVDNGAKEEEFGPPGRVFRNRHPEMSPDIRLYSATEFSLRDHAVRCCLREYLALPVLDLDQNKCIGVLELVEFSDYALKFIREALEAVNLSSVHSKFCSTFPPNQIAECWELALTEIRETFEVVSQIPQLYMAEIWSPNDKCASINGNLRCMELVLSTKSGRNYVWPISQIQHVGTEKGIVGTVLASENKACLCKNSCDFGIAGQPLAHYGQRKRLDICFAICLQSAHTGNLLYVLEFFLNQGPRKYEYLHSVLRLLVSIMKLKLKSFKVASGKQLGEELVVEVIEFSESKSPTFSGLNLPDGLPLKFKIVQYGQKEHQHTKDQEVQHVSDGTDSVRNVAHVKRSRTIADNSKKEDATKKAERGKGRIDLRLKLEDLKPHFGKRLKDVAEELGVGRSTIKRACRSHGIRRWPRYEKYKNNPSLFEAETANEFAPESQQNLNPSSSDNLLLLDMPLQQNVPQTNIESTQHLSVEVEAEKVIVKAKFEDDYIRFDLYLSSGLDKLVEEVAKRLKLKVGSFKLKYVDEDNDEILLACDADLQHCPKSLTAAGKTCIQLLVQLTSK